MKEISTYRKITLKIFQFFWLGLIALISLIAKKLFFPSANYATVFMFIHITVTIIFTQIVLGLSAIQHKREQPWMDLLIFLLWTIASFAINLIIVTLVSTIFKIPFSITYIGTIIFLQLITSNPKPPIDLKSESNEK